MAGAGYKLFNTGDVLTATQVNTYLQEQTVMVFASSTARTTALSGVLAEGMMSYLQDTNAVEVYNGSAWVGVSGAGDVTEVQAGTGISVASGTGPIPVVTNTMATAINAAGDLIYGTANDTFTRLGIGTAGQVLTVNTGATAPEWKTAAAGGSWSSAGSGSLTGSSITVSSLSGKRFFVLLVGSSFDGSEDLRVRLNSDTGNNYYQTGGATAGAQLQMGASSGSAAAVQRFGFFIDLADTSAALKPLYSTASLFGVYASTSAITSITFFPGGGNFDAGTYEIWKQS